MTTAIVGSSGYIANFLIKNFLADSRIESITKIDKHPSADFYLDLADAKNFNYSKLQGINYVVFTAAISSPDKCAEEFDLCWQINVEGTSYFIKEALQHGCKVLFFSSDAVFGDIPGHIYDEHSTTEANTSYGRMKKAIEDEFKNDENFKAIRLSYVASAKDRFISYCLNCIKTGETADIFHPFYRNIISVSDVVNVASYFAHHWDEYAPTFLNVAGKELVSRVRIADELNRLFDNKLKYIISKPGETFFKNRPSITQMQSLFLQRYGIIPDNTFTEKITKEMENIEL